MNKSKRLKHISNCNKLFPKELSICRNCGELGSHYVPASLGEDSYYYCKEKQ